MHGILSKICIWKFLGAKNHERKEFEGCAYKKQNPKVIRTYFIQIQRVLFIVLV
jgi:hypothetical protein